MLFVNIIAFAVLKILHNLVSMQKALLADNCWSKQNYEKCPMWPNLYFHEFSGTLDSFLKIRLVLEINMCKHTEKFHASKSCKYRSFYINFAIFRIEIRGTLLKCFFVLHNRTFDMKMNHFNTAFHMTWEKWQRF